MLLSELFEARKNANINRKTSVNITIINKRNATKDKIAGTTNLFVSFTALDKLGINPGSTDSTPLGIYAYPADYVISEIGSDEPMTNLPYAGEHQFANLFKAKGNIINIQTIDRASVDQYYQRIRDYLETIGEDQYVFDQFDKAIAEASAKAKINTAGGRLWYVTMEVAHLLAESGSGNVPVAWNKLMRAIGIDGCVDIGRDGEGAGIIHENEPCQAVFFSIASVTDVNRVYNRYSADKVKSAVISGRRKHLAANDAYRLINAEDTADGMYQLLNKIGMHWLKLVRDKEIRDQILSRDPQAISHLYRSTARDQRVVLEKDFGNLTIIHVPDQRVVADVFSNNPTSDKIRLIMKTIRRIDEPLQKAIVAFDPRMVLEFDTPYRSTVRAAIANWALPELPSWLVRLAEKFGLPTQR